MEFHPIAHENPLYNVDRLEFGIYHELERKAIGFESSPRNRVQSGVAHEGGKLDPPSPLEKQ